MCMLADDMMDIIIITGDLPMVSCSKRIHAKRTIVCGQIDLSNLTFFAKNTFSFLLMFYIKVPIETIYYYLY